MSKDTMTLDKLKEAKELVMALTPKEAPDDLYLIKGQTGLKIIKSDLLADDTVMVSKRLFDMIFEASDDQPS